MVHDSAARRLLLGLAGSGAVLGAWAGGGLPDALALCYLLTSLASLILYGVDKRAARHDRQRIRERTLQLLAVAGGWPGALLAQALFRHKHRKAAFQWVFLLCTLANVLCVMALLRLTTSH